MKITIYELLGMVKDRGKLPKKVKVLDVIYEFDDHCGDYYNKSLDRYLFIYMTSDKEWKLAFFLNNEVEILEEEKKIPEKLKKKKTINGSFEGKTTYIYKYNEYEIGETINEIIDYLDYLKSKGDE